ncbi:hypothetical protein F5148DRAFT_1281341 [Russula earlei]|uniref:Uncharacterized protein n=1 Tax=Russula earlei TaxID=71964 RepID=A0ACC0UGV9_9AGAM|nr:hypothetical protein F5148DRAFT_1281341 [Russula earlei]
MRILLLQLQVHEHKAVQQGQMGKVLWAENDEGDKEINEDDDLEDWVDELAALKPEEQEMLKDSICPVVKPWKTCLKELELVLKIMPCNVGAIKQMTSECKNDLQQYELTEGEWVIVRELSVMLKILKDAMLSFLCGGFNLPMIIPAMDHINTYFTNAIKPSSSNNPAIQAATRIAKKTLNHYY